MNLFQHSRQKQIEQESPLANRMRPRNLDEYVGQEHILGHGRLLRRAIQADQLASLIFYGPPGTGKTTLAMVIANSTRSHFITLNAVLAGVKEIREAIVEADERRNLHNQRTTLFVDEVHRWNKAQQDALLPHVERGTILLIGATTANPYFEVNSALVSRSRIFQLQPLTAADLHQIAAQALADEERGYGNWQVEVAEEALAHLVNIANGDARTLLNALELAVETTPADEDGVVRVSLAVAEESIQRRAVLYDKDGDSHYDTISAFIKSLRGSDPDAALYWLAKMVYAGEDPRFLFRRMAILASEDIGMADPNAAAVVNNCWQIYEKIGLPEGYYPLANCAIYLATAAKSNSVMAFFDALNVVQAEQEADVPNHLKDGNRDKEGFGHGKGYLYPHAYRDHWVAQQYLPTALQGRLFYQPSDQGYEAKIQAEVARRREAQLAAMLEVEQAAVPEVFTTSPVDKQREAWLQRAINASGKGLAEVREKLFALAEVQRHHRLLDVAGGSGLLVWEGVRRAPEGGVWTAVAEPSSAEILRQQAAQLPDALLRPHIVTAALAELPAQLPPEVRFDRILARQAVSLASQQGALAGLRPWLAPDGRLIIVQTIPRHGQRLYALVDWAGAEALRAQVVAAEEAIYHDPEDGLVNWEVADLVATLAGAGWRVLHQQVERRVEERQITAGLVGRWFGPAPAGARPSYGERLEAAGVDVGAVRGRFGVGQVVGWESAVVWVVAG